MERERILCTLLVALPYVLRLHASGRIPHAALQPFVFNATLLVEKDGLLFPAANERSLLELSNDSEYQFKKWQIQTFANGSILYGTTTILWRRLVQMCSKPLRVCTASSTYYYGLPRPSDLKCVSSVTPVTPHGFKQYEMAVMSHFITKQNYAQLEQTGATNVIIPLLGTNTFTTPTGAILVQTFEVIVYPRQSFDMCNFTHDGEVGSLKHTHILFNDYKRYTLDFLWRYLRPVNIVLDISCLVWQSYTPESVTALSPWAVKIKQKVNISLVRDPAIIFPDLQSDHLVVPIGTRSATLIVMVYSLYKPVDVQMDGKSGRVLAKLISLTATSAMYSISWNKVTTGVYSVVAKNAKGQSETRNISVTTAGPPQLLVDPMEANVGEGASVSFLCLAVSSLPATVKWTRNYLPLDHGRQAAPVRPQYLTKHQTGQELTLSVVDFSDSGTYTCSASNSAGTANKDVHLFVHHQGSFHIDAHYAGPNPMMADTHIGAVLVPVSYDTTSHSILLIGGTAFSVVTILLITFSFTLTKLLTSHYTHGEGLCNRLREP